MVIHDQSHKAAIYYCYPTVARNSFATFSSGTVLGCHYEFQRLQVGVGDDCFRPIFGVV